MKKVLILKTGCTFNTLAEKKGDFEDWIISGMGIERNQTTILNVCKDLSVPDFDRIGGIVITGSHEMITDYPEWCTAAEQWLGPAIDTGIPVLGICYGHQMLAHTLGGTVGFNPNGRELGRVRIFLTDEAKDDELFCKLPESFDVLVSHAQSVTELPPGARLLASNNWDNNQAFIVGNRAWGVQFHPEFDAEILNEYINYHEINPQKKSPTFEKSRANMLETHFSSSILSRFSNIISTNT